MKEIRDVVLTTDLYHQHADPNDHWNLASMYSLAYSGLINFAGIMCDDDRNFSEDKQSFLHFGDPSVQSIAQMNYITGMAVPVGFGSRRPIKKKEDLDAVLSSSVRFSSATLLIHALENSKTKVDIHMCGSCKDVLIAYKKAPELFSEKCGGIYLNAGTYESQDPLEYNVSLEPYAFSQIFDIPCPIYWAPCFHKLIPYPYISAERANYYEIEQSEMVPVMSEALKKYFNFMFSVEKDIGWLTYLRTPLDENVLRSWSDKKRQMWSTPGYLMSAGKDVTYDGEIVDRGQTDKPLFSYEPVCVKVTPEGLTDWHDAAKGEETHVYMFRVHSLENYQKAMSKAVKTLLAGIPEL